MAEWLIGAANRLLKVFRTYTSDLSFSGVASGVKRVITYLGAGVITPTGAISRILRMARGYASSISFSSQTTWTASKRFVAKSASGVLTFTGSLFKGWLYGTVKRVLGMFRTTTGALNMAGTYLYEHGQRHTDRRESFVYFAGVLSSLTAYVKSKSRNFSAGSGIVSRVLNLFRTYPGTLTLTGTSQRTINILAKSYDGAITFTGDLYKAIVRVAYTGTLTLGGALSWLVNYLIVATLTSTGAISRVLNLLRTYSSSLSFSGISSGVWGVVTFSYFVGKAGVLSFTKTLLAQMGRQEAKQGSLTVYGRITFIDAILNRFDGASISPTGVLNRLLRLARDESAGSVSMSGVVSEVRKLGNTYESALSFIGDLTVSLTGTWNYYPVGSLSFAGAYDRLVNLGRTYISELDLSGSISRLINVFRTKDGSLSFAGVTTTPGVVQADWRLGALSFAGGISRALLGTGAKQSELAFAGAVSHTLQMGRSAQGGLTFGPQHSRYRERIYLGPPNF